MHKQIRLLKDPRGGLKRQVLGNLARLRYLSSNGYKAERYWADRHLQYGFDLRGPGNRSLSRHENEKMYRQAAKVFLRLCRREQLDFSRVRILDVGCGTGYYAQVLLDNGATQYLGIDIVDILFDELKSRFPTFEFKRLDVCREQLNGTYGLIAMIDVTQHITRKGKFNFAMRNIREHLAEGGVLIFTSYLAPQKERINFYEVKRTIKDYKRHFPDFVFNEPIPVRDKFIFSIRARG